MKFKIIAIATLALSLSGCAKFLDGFSRLAKSGFTNVKIMPDRSGRQPGVLGFESPLNLLNILDGGVIIYATSTAGTVYSTTGTSEADGSISLTLPNGTYSFTGVGWPTLELEGNASTAA